MMLLESYDASRAIDLVSPHCDLVERLQAVPPSARIRGVWFQTVLNELRARDLLPRYEEYFPNERWTALQFYWVGDYLIRLSLAGAIVAGPADVHGGMYDLNRANSRRFGSTLLGRSLFRLVANDPKRNLQQGMAARRQTMNYGRWLVTFPTPTSAEVTFEEEYIWIESALIGSGVGSFEALGLDVRTRVISRGRFNATCHMEW